MIFLACRRQCKALQIDHAVTFFLYFLYRKTEDGEGGEEAEALRP